MMRYADGACSGASAAGLPSALKQVRSRFMYTASGYLLRCPNSCSQGHGAQGLAWGGTKTCKTCKTAALCTVLKLLLFFLSNLPKDVLIDIGRQSGLLADPEF